MNALRESENKFRAVVTGTHDAIIMMDGQGKVMFWNKAAERIFQYSENEIIGKDPHEIRRAQRYEHPFAMVMVDIDFFKSINDNYGHQTGDLVLQKMAQAIKSALRESDLFGRIGGEEFLVVLIETDRKTAGITSFLFRRFRFYFNNIIKIRSRNRGQFSRFRRSLASFMMGNTLPTHLLFQERILHLPETLFHDIFSRFRRKLRRQCP